MQGWYDNDNACYQADGWQQGATPEIARIADDGPGIGSIYSLV
jgi:hypothetical protein